MRGTRTGWVLLAVLAVGLRAEEKPAPPPAAPAAAQDSIETAKRQFELLKSARDGGATPATALPQTSVPELHPPVPESARKKPALKTEMPTKSGNWLVEAMEKPRDSRKDGERRDRRRGQEEELTGGRLESRRDQAAPGRDPESDASTRDAANRDTTTESSAFNPLAPYLAQWMTPQDYALLGSTIEKNAASGELPGRTGAPGAPVAIGGDRGVAPPGVTGIAHAAGQTIFARPAENPFLQALNLPAAAPGVASAPPSVVTRPAITAAPTFSPPPPAVPPKPKVPDFVKPQTDEKYFKQLKRF